MMLQINLLQDSDIPLVVALWRACELIKSWNDPLADIAQARRSGSAQFFVGKIGQNIVASAMAGDDGHRGWLYYVAVDPAHRGHGYGRALVAAAEAWLEKRGIPKTQLMIRTDNGAVRGFYKALGYDEQPRIIMARWLDGRPITP